MRHLRQRIRDILKASPVFAPDTLEILIEDKAALEFIVREQTAAQNHPVTLILPASKTARSPGALGISLSTARLAVQIHAWPILAADDAPTLDTLALAAELHVHEAPTHPDDSAAPDSPHKARPGAPVFRFLSAEYILVSDSENSVRIEFECPHSVITQRPEPEPPPPEDVPDEALRFFTRSFLNGEGADTPADAAPKDETLRGFLNGFFTGEILAAEDRLPRD
ncbi:MAG: hypothetical protein LBD14_01555, partial [Puniceicoccales bacterium]|nr:hypothetical protein [Puniceicoccales bacterium]